MELMVGTGLVMLVGILLWARDAARSNEAILELMHEQNEILDLLAVDMKSTWSRILSDAEESEDEPESEED